MTMATVSGRSAEFNATVFASLAAKAKTLA
jgi:hypothetical protein